MNSEAWGARKVVIVGAGAVGATFAYALAQSGISDEIILIDHNRELAQGQVLDLAHGFPFFPPVEIRAGEADDFADAQVIVITSGAKQLPGESRLDLLQRNAAIVESIVDDIVSRNSPTVIVVVSNPVDVLTHIVLKRTEWDRGRVLGSGTVLDSARFRYLLSQCSGIDVHNVHAYILGEHGDSEFAAWSLTNIAGMSINKYCPVCMKCGDWKAERARLVEEVRSSAYHIIDYKGATYFAIGLALVRIVGAVLRNQKTVLTVSTLLTGEYGVDDVCLSVPAVVSQAGVERIMEGELSEEERKSLSRSALILRDTLAKLHLM
ncbi:MAG: L-lactate dehydrogenase [Desulfobacteraceae bacterium]|uniref:L-lactate dehydrogenase n=1 Tax=Candidatus Desulfaltia bathyphila TaxID=2841697 RepID=A0A8J6N3P2_9BACT|nr:L-lactate dehydrogenase [Candidatus Desulfaltia bathyphila]